MNTRVLNYEEERRYRWIHNTIKYINYDRTSGHRYGRGCRQDVAIDASLGVHDVEWM
jgi:hypothetical protein